MRPGCESGAQPAVGLLAFAAAQDFGYQGAAPGRHLVDLRDVEITVEGQGERARNRGRRHHQNIGLVALRLQDLALLDAEAVLLVDDGEPEPLEGDAALDEGVGADGDLHRTVGEPLANRGRRTGGAHQLDAAALAEQALQVGEMLFGEELGRRHEGGLETALRREQEADRGDDRLAAADVTLQQAEHRLRAFEVVDDLLHHPLLRAGEGERQHGARRGAGVVVDTVAMALLHRGLERATPGKLKLELQELAVGQARMRSALAAVERLDVGIGRRPVQLAERQRELRQGVALQQLRRQEVGGVRTIGGVESRQRLLEQTAEETRGHSREPRVDRHDAPRAVALGGVDRLAGRIGHFPEPPIRPFDHAVQQPEPAGLETRQEVRLIEPGHRQRTRVVHQPPAHDDEAAPPRADRPQILHPPGDRPRPRPLDLRHPRHPPPVLVAQRHRQQQILHRPQPHPRQLLRPPRPDSAQESQRCV